MNYLTAIDAVTMTMWIVVAVIWVKPFAAAAVVAVEQQPIVVVAVASERLVTFD